MSLQNKSSRSNRCILVGCFFATLGEVTGCNSLYGPPPTPAYMPSWQEARASIEAILKTWRDAPIPLPQSFDTAAVKFVDRRRKPQQRLIAFKILAESSVENARQFTVRLILEGEQTPQLVRYNILGRDPVWVFRLEDYEMFVHWEHPMDAPAPEFPDTSQSTPETATANPPG